MNIYYFLNWILIIFLFIPNVSATPASFVRVDGTQFVINDKPFHFVGSNLHVMHGPDAREKMPLTLDVIKNDGLQMGRIWALGEGLPDAPAWNRNHTLFRAGPTGWLESSFVHLDRVIAEAGNRGIKLIITLSNRWADYGGIPMYLRWAGHYDVESYGYTDRFFTDAACKQWFMEHVRRVVGRVNTVTGLPYRDDPTIFAWELQNEMTGTPEAKSDREKWVVNITRLIKTMDPNHLVVPGLIGYDILVERQQWISMCRLPEVAFCDQHIYPETHKRIQGRTGLLRYIDDRVQLAHYIVGKPIVFGEFGFADQGPMYKRSKWHQTFLERIFFDGGNGGLIWIYQPTLSWKREYAVLVDQKRYTPFRQSISSFAQRIQRRPINNQNPLLGPKRGDNPIAPTHVLITQSYAPVRKWIKHTVNPVTYTLQLPVERFHKAWFEDAGTWAGGILVHAYGRQTGWFEYRFSSPSFIPQKLTIKARLSSEFPGSTAPKNGTSLVKIFLNANFIGSYQVIPDDGIGSWYSVEVQDRAILKALALPQNHVLRFQVDAGNRANGIAIYGHETTLNREPVEEPGPLEIVAVKY